MDRQEEYHDPDYPGTSSCAEEKTSHLSEEEKLAKIREIVRREFSNELEVRENEVMLLDQRMSTSRRLLHRLRYTLVNNYFNDRKLQLTGAQIQDEVAAQHEPRARNEVSSILREGQRRLHPSVRKLLGKQAVDLDEILFRGRAPRNKARKDYSAMLKTRNYTISADATKSLRPDQDFSDVIVQQPTSSKPPDSKPKKIPRLLYPTVSNVVTLDKATRNQMKYRYRIIIGNTSKYAPPASRLDRSTHKWLLYIRGPPHQPDISRIVSAVSVRLHHSYAPHHIVHIDKPPFHVSRRGWGEFPARIELHFTLPERNRPASIEHTIKLDRNYTGLQTLGAETIVDVWLYSTQEMLEYEYKENIEAEKIEPETSKEAPTTEPEQTDKQDNWLDFFSNTTEMDVDEMIIKPKRDENNDIENSIENTIENSIQNSIENSIQHSIENSIEKAVINKDDPEDFIPETQNDINNKDINDINNDIEELPNELLTQQTTKRIMKYLDPTTGKIYYLEMDRNLDLTKVQEIVINSEGKIKTARISPIKSNGLKNVRKNNKKPGISLLKPEVKSLLKTETVNQKRVVKKTFTHIDNDHCYLGSDWPKNSNSEPVLPELEEEKVSVKKEKSLYESLCSAVLRLTSIRVAVNYLLKKIPVISGDARDPDFVKCFPFVVENEEKYWKLDFAKRRNIEWSRAKLINNLLSSHFTHEPIWRTKQILIYSRLHGYNPIRTETKSPIKQNTDWSSWTDLENSRKQTIKELYPNSEDISSLTVFNCEEFMQNVSDTLELSDDEDVEVVDKVKVVDKVADSVVKKQSVDLCSDLTVLPVENEEDRLRFLFIERMCRDIGIELRNEDVGGGFSYSAVHAVMLSAIKSFAEELVRSSLAAKLHNARKHEKLPTVWIGSSSSRHTVSLEHVWQGAQTPRLQAITSRNMAATRKDTYFI